MSQVLNSGCIWLKLPLSARSSFPVIIQLSNNKTVLKILLCYFRKVSQASLNSRPPNPPAAGAQQHIPALKLALLKAQWLGHHCFPLFWLNSQPLQGKSSSRQRSVSCCSIAVSPKRKKQTHSQLIQRDPQKTLLLADTGLAEGDLVHLTAQLPVMGKLQPQDL